MSASASAAAAAWAGDAQGRWPRRAAWLAAPRRLEEAPRAYYFTTYTWAAFLLALTALRRCEPFVDVARAMAWTTLLASALVAALHGWPAFLDIYRTLPGGDGPGREAPPRLAAIVAADLALHWAPALVLGPPRTPLGAGVAAALLLLWYLAVRPAMPRLYTPVIPPPSYDALVAALFTALLLAAAARAAGAR